MGTIINTKARNDGKIILEILLNYEEIIQLKGHMDNIIVFSDNISHLKTNISTRGKNGITKYLLIPRDLRQNINLDKEVNCQKIDFKEKTILIYSVDKSNS